MVVPHTLRSIFYFAQGVRARRTALDQYTAFCLEKGIPERRCLLSGDLRLPWTAEVRNTVYMGFRTGSHIPYNHVNHARFAEAMEFGRWHSLGLNGTLSLCRKAKLYPTVQSINIQYMREMSMPQRIVSRLQFWGVSEDAKAVNCLQQLESIDGGTLYATGITRIAWVNFPSYRSPEGSLHRGAVPINDVMRRLGCSNSEVDQFLAGLPVDGVDRPFGSHVSHFMHKGGVEVGSQSEVFSLRHTYPDGSVSALNCADAQWRTLLSDVNRSRRSLVACVATAKK